MNIDYAIHRYGEWTMLMLGESVLSLLIVDVVVTIGYISTFLAGIVSIVLLEYLHFQSQPSEPDKHAYRGTPWSGFTFYWVMQIYSMALIVLGASFKMLLFEQLYEANDDGSSGSETHRRNLFVVGGGGRGMLAAVGRVLAGGESSAALRFTAPDRQQRIAHFFAASLTVVFLSLDIISLAHRGMKANLERCHHHQSTKQQCLVLALVGCRIAVLLFTATLSQYFTSPDYLAVVGLGTVIAQLFLRVFASVLFFHDAAEIEDAAIQRVIDYNTARMHKVPDHSSSSRAND
jgi:hypothetical protein